MTNDKVSSGNCWVYPSIGSRRMLDSIEEYKVGARRVQRVLVQSSSLVDE